MSFTNYTALTAYDLGTSRPVSLTIPNADIIANPNAGYPFWFKFTAQASDTVMPFWAMAPVASNYLPFAVVYLGPASAPTEYLFLEAFYVPMMIPVVAGTEYFVQVTQDGGGAPNADLIISMLASPNVSSVVGDIIFTDFTPGFYPGIIAANGIGAYSTAYKKPIPTICSADFGDILPNGITAFIDNSTSSPDIRVYNTSYAQTSVVSGITDTTTNQNRINANGLDKFYVARWHTTTTTLKRFVAATGAIDADSWSWTGAPSCIAVSRDNLILYWGDGLGIHRHDLTTDLPLSDIIAAISNYANTKDMFVMSDGTTLLIPYSHQVIGQPDFVKWYNRTTGTLIGTYSLAVGEFIDRVALNKDDGVDSFWIALFKDNESITFRQIDMATSLQIGSDVDLIQFNNGLSSEPQSDDMFRLGISNSCPLVLIRSGEVPPASNRSGIYKIVPDKRNDTLWLDVNSGTTEVVKIP